MQCGQKFVEMGFYYLCCLRNDLPNVYEKAVRNAVLSRVSAQNLVTKPQFLSNARPPPSRAWLLSGSFPCQIHHLAGEQVSAEVPDSVRPGGGRSLVCHHASGG